MTLLEKTARCLLIVIATCWGLTAGLAIGSAPSNTDQTHDP